MKITKSIQYNIILFLVFFLPILFDLLYGFLNVFLNYDFSVSAYFRSGVIILLLPYIFRQDYSIIHFYFSLLAILFLLLLSIWGILGFNHELGREIEQFIRILYPLLILFFLRSSLKKGRLKDINQISLLLIYTGLIIALSIIFSYWTGYGLETYGDYSFGVSSFFKAQNDITLLMILIINIALFQLTISGKYLYLLLAIIIFLSLTLLGTRAGLIGGISVFILHIFMLLFSNKSKLNIFKKIFLSTLILTGFTYITIKVVEKISEYSYLVEKYNSVLEESPRAKLESAGMNVLESRNTLENVIGQGTVPFGKGVETYYSSSKEYLYGKLVEQDFLDMIGAYGYILGSLILIFPITIFFKSFLIVLKDRNILSLTLFSSMFLFLSHSFLAGHAINSPTVSMGIVVIYFSVIHYSQLKSKYSYAS